METIMDFLKNSQKLRVIPDEIKGISNGIIQEVCPEYFMVCLDDANNLSIQDNIEIIISADNCLIRFDTKVIKIEGKTVYFSIPKEFRYIQRREYTRVDINIPIKLREFNELEYINSFSENISGGGMQIISTKYFDIGNLLEAKFNVFEAKDINTVLKVLRIDSQSENKEECHLSGEFEDISNADRTAIIQLCFKRHLELKCKEDIMSD
jgi:c-di-GMP-binding flagellar brake protein YcgR